MFYFFFVLLLEAFRPDILYFFVYFNWPQLGKVLPAGHMKSSLSFNGSQPQASLLFFEIIRRNRSSQKNTPESCRQVKWKMHHTVTPPDQFQLVCVALESRGYIWTSSATHVRLNFTKVASSVDINELLYICCITVILKAPPSFVDRLGKNSWETCSVTNIKLKNHTAPSWLLSAFPKEY